MKAKHLVTGVALLGTIMASMAGGRLGGTPRAAHAGLGLPNFGRGVCVSCQLGRPSVTLSFLQANPLSVSVSGTNFLSGAAVHLDLLLAPITFASPPDGSGEPNAAPIPQVTPAPVVGAPQSVASLDTTASFTLTLPLGTGQVIHVAGGNLAAALTATAPTCGQFRFWVVATDVATGLTYSTGQFGTGAAC